MTTLNLQVGASADDADESTAGVVGLTNLSRNVDNVAEWVGCRFQNVTILQGATINSAFFTVYVTGGTVDEPFVVLTGDDVDNSAQFTTDANNISGRTDTTASVNWDDTDIGSVAGGFEQWGAATTGGAGTDIKAIIQEIVDRGGWASGNALSLLYHQPSTSATRDLDVEFYDSNTTHAAKLDLDFTNVVRLTVGAVLDKVTASLNAEQAGGAVSETVVSTIDEVTASLTIQQQFLLTVASDLDKVTAALNAVMVPAVTIESTIDKVIASLNAVVTDVATTITSTVAEVTASLNLVMQPTVTVQSTIDEVSGSLNAEHIHLVTIGATLDKVEASLNVVMLPTVTIASTIDEALASLNVVAGVTAAQIASTLDEVAASLNVLMQPAVTIQSTLDEVFASLTVEQRQLLTIASTIDEATASLAANQTYLTTIASVLDETSGSFNVSQLYLATVIATLAEVQAALNAAQLPSVTIQSTLRELAIALAITQASAQLMPIQLRAEYTPALALAGAYASTLKRRGDYDPQEERP